MSKSIRCEEFEKPKLKKVKIKDIVIPEVRVTSVFPEELEPLFKASIQQLGIVNPIKLICEDGKLILVDGLHRLLEAKNKGEEEIDAVVVKGTLKDVMVQNLATGKLQGRGKITDMIKVVKTLYEQFGMGIDEIAKSTGYSEEYIDNLLRIGNANEEILDALDRELIPLGAAVEIARIPDQDAQVAVLYQVIAYRMKVKDVKDLVDRVIKLKMNPEYAAKQVKEKPSRDEVLIKCQVCGENHPVRDMRSIIVCPTCFAAILEVRKEIARELKETEKSSPGVGEEVGKKEVKEAQEKEIKISEEIEV